MSEVTSERTPEVLVIERILVTIWLPLSVKVPVGWTRHEAGYLIQDIMYVVLESENK